MMQLLQQMQKVKQSNDNKRKRAEISGSDGVRGLILFFYIQPQT